MSDKADDSRILELTPEHLAAALQALQRPIDRDTLPERWIRDPGQFYQFYPYHGPRMAEWLEGRVQDWPMDLNLAGIMLQEILDRGKAIQLDLAVFRLAAHFAEIGVCSLHGRRLH